MSLPVALLGPGECYAVESRSRKHKPWIVVRLVENRFACSCPSTKECAHIRAVKAIEDHRALRAVRS